MFYLKNFFQRIYIVRCYFQNNNSTFDSNCLQADAGSLLQVIDSFFVNNTLYEENWEAYGSGTAGAIHSTYEKLLVANCSFLSNRNYRGGAIMINGNKKTTSTSLYINNTFFSKNGAAFGGAMFFGPLITAIKEALVSNCIFQENKALSTNWDQEFSLINI